MAKPKLDEGDGAHINPDKHQAEEQAPEDRPGGRSFAGQHFWQRGPKKNNCGAHHAENHSIKERIGVARGSADGYVIPAGNVESQAQIVDWRETFRDWR